jgi:pilus assembly protein CpaE
MANILIVDDDHDILKMMEFALKRAGHNPIITTSGEAGLKQIKEASPDLIIVDIMMPEMTGYEFTRQVRDLPGQTNLPILIYSARFQPIDRQTALDAGASAYMPKNVAPPEIIEKVNELLGPDSSQAAGVKSQTIACFSFRGGVGITTMAVNLAVIFALARKTPVCLTDLNPLAGHASLMLGLRPQVSLLNVLALPGDSLSGQVVKDYLARHTSGVQLLASPLIPAEYPANHRLPDLFQALQTDFSFNLIDMPHYLNDDQLALLPGLSKLILVLAPDVPSLQSAVAAIKYLTQHGLSRDKIVPILNHNSSMPALPAGAIQNSIHLPLAEAIPYEPELPAAIKAGKPLVLYAPKSPAAAALAKFARALIQ